MTKEQQTRERLIEAAGQCFAAKGYRGATIKDICEAAGANIAAVNYHFGDKEQLYHQVLRHAHDAMRDESQVEGFTPATTPEEKLAAYVRGFISNLTDASKPAWYSKIMAREMIEPTSALDTLVEQEIGPKYNLLRSIISELMQRDIDDEQVQWCATSVIAECLFWHHDRPVIERVRPELSSYSDEVIERIIQHVTRFTLDAIRQRAIESETDGQSRE